MSDLLWVQLLEMVPTYSTLIVAHLVLGELLLQEPELLPQVAVLPLQVHVLILELVLLPHHSYVHMCVCM